MSDILIACEYSGVVSDAFIDQGFDAISCDMLPTESPGPHYQGPIEDILHAQRWKLVVAFPPCTYLTTSGNHQNKKNPARAIKTEQAIDFVRDLLWSPADHVAIENPVGLLSTRLRKPDQVIQPYQFGENASKRTCLWLRNLPALTPTFHIPPRLIEHPADSGKLAKRWANQTRGGHSKLGSDIEDRAKQRARTYPGIALAMARQWGAALQG